VTPEPSAATSVIAGGQQARVAIGRVLLLVGGLVGVVVVYGFVFRDLLTLWINNPYYSYGPLVPLWSAWLVATTRVRLATPRIEGDLGGLFLVTGGLSALALAGRHESLTLATLSLPLVLAGIARIALGRDGFARLRFPLAFLALMTPLPPAVMRALSHELQSLAAASTSAVLTVLGIPFARDGLFVHLQGTTVHISEGCNGLRFLLATAVLGVALGWATRQGMAHRLLLLGIGVGAAIAANLVRVSATAVAVHAWGPAAAVGLPHLTFGKAVYLVALGFVGLVALRLRR
jgi:exosortase